MKLGKAQESTEQSGGRKLYTGVAPVKVLAVNPTKEKMKGLFNWNIEKEPEYTGEKDNVKWVNITMYVKPDVEGVDDIIAMKFFLRDQGRTNNGGDKVQITNDYGEFAWITKEDFEACKLPSMNFAEEGIRQAFSGEEPLVNFLKTYLNVPGRTSFKEGQWVESEDPQLALFQLEQIDSYFSGNISEIEDALNIFPDNKVKVWFGVQKGDNNVNYQTFFPAKFARNSARKADFIKSAIDKAKAAGVHGNVDFGEEAFKEYSETPTDFQPEKPVDKETVRSKWVK